MVRAMKEHTRTYNAHVQWNLEEQGMRGYRRLPEAVALEMQPREGAPEASAGAKVEIRGESPRRGWSHAEIGTPDKPDSRS